MNQITTNGGLDAERLRRAFPRGAWDRGGRLSPGLSQRERRRTGQAGSLPHERGTWTRRLRLDQFLNRLFVADEVLGAAGGVHELGLADVDAEVVVEGGKDFQQVDGAVLGFFGIGGAGADGLAELHAAAGEE